MASEIFILWNIYPVKSLVIYLGRSPFHWDPLYGTHRRWDSTGELAEAFAPLTRKLVFQRHFFWPLSITPNKLISEERPAFSSEGPPSAAFHWAGPQSINPIPYTVFNYFTLFVCVCVSPWLIKFQLFEPPSFPAFSLCARMLRLRSACAVSKPHRYCDCREWYQRQICWVYRTGK